MSASWTYVNASGSQVGPVPEQELASMLQRSEIPMETPLWREGMASWKQAREVEEFAAIKPTVPPPGDYDEVWYYLSRARERKGPVSGMVLARMVSTGELDGMALVWGPQFGEMWKPMARVPELKAMIRRVQSATAEKPDGDAEAGAHRYVTPSGETLVFDAKAKKWVSEEANGAGAPAQGAKGGEAAHPPPAAEDDGARAAKARKRERSRNSRKRKTREAAMRKILYVAGLPGDVTERELSDMFSKYGVFQVDLETGEPRIKLYRDEEGNPKGDGTIAYLREESVDLAIEMVDGDSLRGHRLHVEPAKFESKPAAEGATQEASAPKRRRKPLSHLAKIRAKAQEQLLSWNEGVGEDSPKIVVVLHMFEPADFKDPKFEEQLKADIDEGFGVYGEIEKVTVFEKNPLGVLIIKFKEPYAAEQCVRHTDGRFYAGRRLQCKYWDGTDYAMPEEEEAEVKEKRDQERIHSFGDWLEGASSDSSDDVAVEGE